MDMDSFSALLGMFAFSTMLFTFLYSKKRQECNKLLSENRALQIEVSSSQKLVYELQGKQAEQRNSRIRTLQQEMYDLGADVYKLKQECDRLSSENRTLQTEVDAAHIKVDTAQKNVYRLQEELDTAHEQSKALRTEAIIAHEQAYALQAETDRMYTQLSERDKKISELQKKLDTVHEQSKTLRTEAIVAHEQAYALQAETDRMYTQLSERDKKVRELQEELRRHKSDLLILQDSNLTAIPWLAGMMADFLTYDFEIEAKKLDWGRNIQRAKKVASIRALRAEATRRIAEAKEAVYQLEYLRRLFPGIDDVLLADYKDLRLDGKIPDHDPAMDYLSKEEWRRLGDVERNQLALDRYVSSRQKSKWQIGRDYELAVAHEYRQAGYFVDTIGSYMKLEDMGRDLIARKGTSVHIIQCKYWGQHKQIHEKHIYQLFGTTVGYCIEHHIQPERVKGVFITNIEMSHMAKKVADYLGILYREHHPMVEFPRIKCNIGRDESGRETKIFHLPMDSQYDATKIDRAGEFYAFTVQEAVDAGFRRAFKWHGR